MLSHVSEYPRPLSDVLFFLLLNNVAYIDNGTGAAATPLPP